MARCRCRGSRTITLTDPLYEASSDTTPLTIGSAAPTFTFSLSALPAKAFGDAPFSVASFATTNSPGAVTFALGAGSVGCTVSPVGQVTLTGAALGTQNCIIEASLAAGGSYGPAGPISASFHIAKRSQTITFGAAPTGLVVGATGKSVSATATSTLAVTYGSTTPSVCTVGASSGVLTLLTAGPCTITANQAGDANWAAALRRRSSSPSSAPPRPSRASRLGPSAAARECPGVHHRDGLRARQHGHGLRDGRHGHDHVVRRRPT